MRRIDDLCNSSHLRRLRLRRCSVKLVRVKAPEGKGPEGAQVMFTSSSSIGRSSVRPFRTR
jgi:hypothetical protein